MSPEIECLVVAVNNCNGGVLEVQNDCADLLVFDGVAVASGETVVLDVVKEDEERRLVEISSNFSEYIPERDERVEVSGRLGNRDVAITFTKTAPLCE